MPTIRINAEPEPSLGQPCLDPLIWEAILAKPASPQPEIMRAEAARREQLRRSLQGEQDAHALPARRTPSGPALALDMADFGNAPAVDEVDLSAYRGAVGDRITVRTGAPVGALRVHLADADGREIECGQASEVPPCSNSWVYFATQHVSGGAVRIRVQAGAG